MRAPDGKLDGLEIRVMTEVAKRLNLEYTPVLIRARPPRATKPNPTPCRTSSTAMSTPSSPMRSPPPTPSSPRRCR
ncbi:hypothetical protein [Rhizobium sp. 16-528-1A]|nr:MULTISPECIES: hypothetical protein [unclassified Rhizobium]